MASILDFLTGGNVKVASAKVIDRYIKCGSSYRQAFEKLTLEAIENMHNTKNMHSAKLIGSHHAKNFTELVVLDLNLYAAPRGTPYQQTLNDFSSDIKKYLRRKGVPEVWISGNVHTFYGENP